MVDNPVVLEESHVTNGNGARWYKSLKLFAIELYKRYGGIVDNAPVSTGNLRVLCMELGS